MATAMVHQRGNCHFKFIALHRDSSLWVESVRAELNGWRRSEESWRRQGDRDREEGGCWSGQRQMTWLSDTAKGELSRTYVNKYGAGKSCVKKRENEERGRRSDWGWEGLEETWAARIGEVEEKLLQCRIDFYRPSVALDWRDEVEKKT